MKKTLLFLFVAACAPQTKTGVDSSGPAEPTIRPVESVSDGECPDMSATNTGTFSSAGQERTVTMVIPDTPTESMPLIYFFHGLLDPQSTPQPTSYISTVLGLQRLANDMGVVFALPQSGVMSRLGIQFFMWDVEDANSPDIVLVDDIRACAFTELGIDLARVHAVGNSGGALFTTMVVRERSDALASMVEISGGSDIEMLTFDSALSAYETPTTPVPSLLISGGENDEWPGGGITLVDFDAATDSLEDQLMADGHFVIRCRHSLGHSVPMTAIGAMQVWTEHHVFNEESSIEDAGVEAFDELAGWCTVPG